MTSTGKTQRSRDPGLWTTTVRSRPPTDRTGNTAGGGAWPFPLLAPALKSSPDPCGQGSGYPLPLFKIPLSLHPFPPSTANQTSKLRTPSSIKRHGLRFLTQDLSGGKEASLLFHPPGGQEAPLLYQIPGPCSQRPAQFSCENHKYLPAPSRVFQANPPGGPSWPPPSGPLDWGSQSERCSWLPVSSVSGRRRETPWNGCRINCPSRCGLSAPPHLSISDLTRSASPQPTDEEERNLRFPGASRRVGALLPFLLPPGIGRGGGEP